MRLSTVLLVAFLSLGPASAFARADANDCVAEAGATSCVYDWHWGDPACSDAERGTDQWFIDTGYWVGVGAYAAVWQSCQPFDGGAYRGSALDAGARVDGVGYVNVNEWSYGGGPGADCGSNAAVGSAVGTELVEPGCLAGGVPWFPWGTLTP
ncbi:MAG: hypothetical protein ACYDCK_06340 [Thermoplasmatota archaeon]